MFVITRPIIVHTNDNSFFVGLLKCFDHFGSLILDYTCQLLQDPKDPKKYVERYLGLQLFRPDIMYFYGSNSEITLDILIKSIQNMKMGMSSGFGKLLFGADSKLSTELKIDESARAFEQELKDACKIIKDYHHLQCQIKNENFEESINDLMTTASKKSFVDAQNLISSNNWNI